MQGPRAMTERAPFADQQNDMADEDLAPTRRAVARAFATHVLRLNEERQSNYRVAAIRAFDEVKERFRLMVAGNLYRHPGRQAKIGATIDHLSGGRLEFGLGAAWNEPEFTELGMEFPPLGERLGRFGEAVRVIKRLWTKDKASFKGK